MKETTAAEIKRGPGRPKMTEEQKLEAKRSRELKKSQLNNKNVLIAPSMVESGKGGGKNVKIPNTNVTSSDKDLASSVMNMEGYNSLIDIQKLSKNQKILAGECTKDEARFLVDSYYQVQQYRIAIGGQLRSIYQGKTGDKDSSVPPQAEVLQWLFNNIMGLENEIKKCLDSYTTADPVGKWAKSIMGIGPVLAAGLISYFDITRAPSVAHFYSYAGLNDQNNPWLGKEKAAALVDKYCTPMKNGCTEYEFYKAIDLLNTINMCDTDLEWMDSDIKEFSDSKNLKTAAKIQHPKWIASVLNDVCDSHHKDEMTDIEMNLVFNDPCHTRSLSSIKKMAWDEEKQKYSKKKLKAELAKPPYNRELKKLLFLVGESFVKVSGNPKSVYGQLISERKAYENAKNEHGDYAEQAERILNTKKFDKKTDAYKWYSQGMLPPGHIHARSKRKAVQIFVSHLFNEMYINYYNSEPPRHYVEVYMEHVDMIEPEVPFSPIDPNKLHGRPGNSVRVY